MTNGDRKHWCGWCGDPVPETPGHTTPECCSEECAKAYAYDVRRPKQWRRYCTSESLTPCTRCSKHNPEPEYRMCAECRAGFASTMRRRRAACVGSESAVRE